MGEQKNTIMLNGKLYDARSGAILKSSVHHQSSAKPKVSARHNRSLDGFINAKPTASVTRVKTHQPSASQKVAPKTVASAHKVHQHVQRSKTLMRSVVQRPAHATTSMASQKAVKEEAKADPRLHRALQVPKSDAISRFSHSAASSVVKRTATLPVQVPPAHINKHEVAPIPAASPEDESLDSLFAKVLGQATSHEQPRLARTKLRHRVAKRLGTSSKVVSVSAGILAVLVLGGFFAMQNVPNLSMRVASAKAGLHGTLPGYRPSGFAMSNSIKYQPGAITVNFHSNSDTRAFHLTEVASNWNSETLLDSYVSAHNQAYQVFQENGRTIYIYNDSNASWVDGGIWYRVEGNSSLTSDQLLKIADSV